MLFYKNSLTAVFFFLIISSVFLYSKVNHLASGVHYNFLPASLIFEGLMLLFFSMSLVGRVNKKYLFFFFLSMLYIFYGFSNYLVVDNPGKLTDFLLIYKPFIYICMLSIFYGKVLFERSFLNQLYILISFAFFVKYVVSIFIFNIDRPGVFTENNFELMLLGLLFLSTYDDDKKFDSVNYLLLVLIAGLSFSRSAILFVLVIFFFLDFKGFLKNKLIKNVSLVFLVFVASVVFLSRVGESGIESVDRYIFLNHFLREMSNDGLWVWLFGKPPMTNVTFATASSLEYYYLVFSDHQNLVAFSAIFNSFILRIVFDHGVVGLGVIIYFCYTVVRTTTFSNRIALSVCSIVLINGLSVSSFQSVYFLLGMFMLISRERKTVRFE